ncbi:MAG: ABC transporter substrate-binding protein [Candidatus Heimdallarchaeota archaeon]
MQLQQKKHKKTHILALGLIMIVLLLPGCIGQKEEEITLATDPDTLVIGMDTSDSVSLDPAQAYEFSSCMAVFALYDQLVAPNPEDYSIIEPALAESWDISADGKTYTFHLRNDVTFHSGNKMTADDVVWSFKRLLYLDMAPDWVVLQLGLTEEGIKKIDDYTMSLTFDEAYAEFLALSCLTFTVGSVVDSKVAMEHEEKTDAYPDGDMGNTWLNDHDAGTGGFKLDHWDKLVEIVMLRNDNWWKMTPGVKKVIYKDIPEPSTQMLQLQEGDIDVAWDLLTDQINEIRNTQGIRIQWTTQFNVAYVGMNMYKFEPFRDERVRDAVRWSIDYDGIINEILGGGAVKGQTFLPYGMLGHNPAMPYYRDINKAKELLAAAGYANGFDVEMICPNTPPANEIAVKIASDLADAGIRVTVTQMVSGEMYQVYRAQNHEMIWAGWGADYPDPDANAKPFAHCETNEDTAKIRQLAWRNMAENPELAAMVDAAALEPDQATRVGMYMEIQERVLDWGPFAIVYYPLLQVGVRTWVEGLNLSPMFYGGAITGVYKDRVAA